MRFLLGGAALVAGLVAPIPRGWRVGLLGLAATELITASTEYCPLNEALGVNTKQRTLTEAAKEAVEAVEPAMT